MRSCVLTSKILYAMCMHENKKALQTIDLQGFVFFSCAPYGTRTCDLYHVKVTL